MGNGDGEFGSPWSLNNNKSSRQQQAIQARDYFNNFGYNQSVVAGRAVPIGGGSGISGARMSSGSSTPQQPSADWMRWAQSQVDKYGGFIGHDGKGYYYSHDQIPFGSSRNGRSVPLPGRPGSPFFGPAVPPPGEPGSPFFGPAYDGYGGFDTGYASVGSSGDGYGNPFDTGTTPFNDYGYGGYTGGDFGTGGSTVGDVASQYMGSGGSDYTSGGFGSDTGAMDYGGGSIDYGYFATGGKFTVGGDGGIDTTLVQFHGTKGEEVEIKPAGAGATPTSVLMPTSAASSSPASSNDPSAQTNATSTTNKIVNIHVQAGIQADSFIRSRAQIARGI
jgi:hypothetical protein